MQPETAASSNAFVPLLFTFLTILFANSSNVLLIFSLFSQLLPGNWFFQLSDHFIFGLFMLATFYSITLRQASPLSSNSYLGYLPKHHFSILRLPWGIAFSDLFPDYSTASQISMIWASMKHRISQTADRVIKGSLPYETSRLTQLMMCHFWGLWSMACFYLILGT